MLVVVQWADAVNECLKKRGLDVRQARRMVRVCEGKCMGRSPKDEPLTFTRCHSCGLQQLYEPFDLWPSQNLMGIKGKYSVFLLS